MPFPCPTLAAIPLVIGALLAPVAQAADPAVQRFLGGAVEASSIAADPDGNAYVLAAEGAPIGKVSPTGAKSSITFPDAIGPSVRLRGLAYGPDGALWFSYNGMLTRVTQAGARTDLPIATSARPVTGPDGNLWLPETDTAMIARVTPAGLITRFPGASPGKLGPLAVGGDGNLWYANATAGVLGRVTEAGLITELPLPAGWTLTDQSPIAADGAAGLWVLLDDGSFGHLDFAGRALGRHAEGLTNEPRAIALGADGNLWFTERHTAGIGWITPSGEIHELLAPFGEYDRPSDITAAGDGALWTTDFSYAQVWRIGPVLPPAPAPAGGTPTTTGTPRSEPQPVTVVAQSKAAPLPRVALARDARWTRHGKATIFTRLTLRALPAGTRLKLTCRGDGCGFASYSTVLRRATKTTNLLPRLHGSMLRRGAVVELRVTRAGHVGRVVRWTIGTPTRTTALCLAPGATAPRAC